MKLSVDAGLVHCFAQARQIIANLEGSHTGDQTILSESLDRSTLSVHRIPPYVRDDRETPLCWDGMREM
jgi:hypothetical protein